MWGALEVENGRQLLPDVFAPPWWVEVVLQVLTEPHGAAGRCARRSEVYPWRGTRLVASHAVAAACAAAAAATTASGKVP